MNSLTLEESIFTNNELLIRAPSFNSPHLYSPTTRAPSIFRGAAECCDRNIGSGGSDADGDSNVSGEERDEIATREGRKGELKMEMSQKQPLSNGSMLIH